MFYLYFLKDWKTASLQEYQPVPTDDVSEVEEPYYEIEKILRWHKVKKRKNNFAIICSVMEGISR